MRDLAPQSDQELLALARKGGSSVRRAAWGLLIDRHGGAVHRFVNALVRDAQAADDTYQEVFFRLFKSPPWRSDSDVRRWLFTVARRLCFEKRPASMDPDAWDAIASATPEPVDDAIAREQQDSLQQRVSGAIDALPERQREALAYAVDGHRYEEIARLMVITESTARGHVREAINALRLAIGHDGWLLPRRRGHYIKDLPSMQRFVQ